MTAAVHASRHPLLALFARYAAVLRAAWTERAALAGPTRTPDEIAFLPAALSLQETPSHPAPHRLAWVLIALFLLALAWAVCSEVDIVAVAPGRVIVSDRTKVIQPLEASVVRRVLVKDGDRVRKGQVLVQLDPTMAQADKATIKELLADAVSDELRSSALIAALAANPGVALAQHAGQIPEGRVRRQLQAEWQDIAAKLARLDAEMAHRRAELATVQATIGKIETSLPMLRAREADLLALGGQGFVSGHATQDKMRERIELERDLLTQRARLAEANSAIREAEQGAAAYRTDTLRLLSDRQAQAASKHQQLNADFSKAGQREYLTQLTAPVDGIVQQLAVHTTGGVVTVAQPLMIVVPDAEKVGAEVSIANQDIGFVYAGQKVEVKLETFPYTRYGTVQATVSIVTADAVVDEKIGSFYPATLTFRQKDIVIDGKRVALTPGMNITAEIKTGRRRIIDFLLSPVQRAGSESLRER